MAKCRNCKKEIDATATRCPYCHTEMPTSDFIAKLKGVIITLVLFGVFALAIYLGTSSLIRKIADNISGIASGISFFIGSLIAIFAIALFKWVKNDELLNPRRAIIIGIVCAIISIFLIVFSLSFIF